MAAQYQSVPIRKLGGISGINSEIELACNTWAKQGYLLNRSLTINVEVKNNVWEDVTYLIFEKIEA